jgi:hypothetical protein
LWPHWTHRTRIALRTLRTSDARTGRAPGEEDVRRRHAGAGKARRLDSIDGPRGRDVAGVDRIHGDRRHQRREGGLRLHRHRPREQRRRDERPPDGSGAQGCC